MQADPLAPLTTRHLRPVGLDFVTLADHLEALLRHEVDLVSRRAVKPMLWKQIERQSKIGPGKKA